MSLSIVLNSDNVVTNGTKSQYAYNFINGGLTIPEGSLMCISNVTIPYSWFIIISCTTTIPFSILSLQAQDNKHSP